MGISKFGLLDLNLAQIGTAVSTDISVGPGLGSRPCNGVVAILGFCLILDDKFALRLETAAYILDRHNVSLTGKVIGGISISTVKETLFVIGQPDEYDRKLLPCPYGKIEVGRKLNPIPHRDPGTPLYPHLIFSLRKGILILDKS
jgi:hypothetical protein